MYQFLETIYVVAMTMMMVVGLGIVLGLVLLGVLFARCLR